MERSQDVTLQHDYFETILFPKFSLFWPYDVILYPETALFETMLEIVHNSQEFILIQIFSQNFPPFWPYDVK